MQNALKIAISLPKVDFYKLEKIRKRLGFGRSAIIDQAIRFWLERQEREDLIKRYEDGYRNKPEAIAQIKAMERASAEAFKEEGLE